MKLSANTVQLSMREALIISTILFITLLIFEIALGIGPGNAHIDETTYLNISNSSLWHLIGNTYIIIISNIDEFTVLTIQFILFLITQALLYRFLKDNDSGVSIFLVLWYLDPYKTHLYMHFLKDSWVITAVVIGYTIKPSIYGFILSSLFRLWSIIYFIPIIFNTVSRNLKQVIFSPITIIIIALLISDPLDLVAYYLNGGNSDMRFKAYDQVVTFNNLGLWGDLLRAAVWPFLFYSGAFILMFNNYMVIPSALANILAMFFIFKRKKEYKVVVHIYLSIAIFAFLTPGFTSFFRYIYPIVVVAPIAVLTLRSKK